MDFNQSLLPKPISDHSPKDIGGMLREWCFQIEICD